MDNAQYQHQSSNVDVVGFGIQALATTATGAAFHNRREQTLPNRITLFSIENDPARNGLTRF